MSACKDLSLQIDIRPGRRSTFCLPPPLRLAGHRCKPSSRNAFPGLPKSQKAGSATAVAVSKFSHFVECGYESLEFCLTYRLALMSTYEQHAIRLKFCPWYTNNHPATMFFEQQSFLHSLKSDSFRFCCNLHLNDVLQRRNHIYRDGSRAVKFVLRRVEILTGNRSENRSIYICRAKSMTSLHCILSRSYGPSSWEPRLEPSSKSYMSPVRYSPGHTVTSKNPSTQLLKCIPKGFSQFGGLQES